MATGAKQFEFRECFDCGWLREVRKDSKAIRCKSCSKLGPRNPNHGDVKFTGTLTEYKKYHKRVYDKRGKASKCINGCEASRYHWANISGRYDDIMDYQEMCPTCHFKMDRKWGTEDSWSTNHQDTLTA